MQTCPFLIIRQPALLTVFYPAVMLVFISLPKVGFCLAHCILALIGLWHMNPKWLAPSKVILFPKGSGHVYILVYLKFRYVKYKYVHKSVTLCGAHCKPLPTFGLLLI